MPIYDSKRAFLAFGLDLDIGCKKACGVSLNNGFKIAFEDAKNLKMHSFYKKRVAALFNKTHVIILAHSNGRESLVCQHVAVAATTLAKFLDSNFPEVKTVDIFACSLGANTTYGYKLFDAFTKIGDNSVPDIRLPKYTVAQNHGIVCLVRYYTLDFPKWDDIPDGHIIENSTIGSLDSYDKVVGNEELFLSVA